MNFSIPLKRKKVISRKQFYMKEHLLGKNLTGRIYRLPRPEIYIDGELRTEYDTKDTRPFGADSASRYVFCRTVASDAGKELRIELESNSKMYSGIVNEIFCGDKMDIWTYIFGIYFCLV